MIVSQSTLLSRHEGLLKQKQFVWIILYMHYDNYNVSQYSKIPFWEKQNCNFLLACSRNYFIFLDKLFYCVQKAGCHLSMHLSALLQLIQNRNKIFSHFNFLKFTQYENNFLCQAFYYDKGWSLFVISIEIKYWEKIIIFAARIGNSIGDQFTFLHALLFRFCGHVGVRIHTDENHYSMINLIFSFIVSMH